MVPGSRIRISGFGFQDLDFGFQDSDFGFRIPGFGFRAAVLGFSVSGCLALRGQRRQRPRHQRDPHHPARGGCRAPPLLPHASFCSTLPPRRTPCASEASGDLQSRLACGGAARLEGLRRGSQRLAFCRRTTSATTAPCISKRMCCPTNCARYVVSCVKFTGVPRS